MDDLKRWEVAQKLNQGFQTAFVDWTNQSNLAYRPEFLSNDRSQGRKVLVSIEEELSHCQEFWISVAFITKSGITPLLQVLKDLENKGVPGRILTTNYLNFSDPDALEMLAALKNIELKIFRTDDESYGFHTKGYIFRREEIYRVIIGSSNITASAMTVNREWNTKLVSTANGELIKGLRNEFNSFWNDSHTLSYDSYIDEYRLEYLREKMIRQQQKEARAEKNIKIDRYTLEPNKMQVAFLDNLIKLKQKDVQKMLLLSATGTGKTYASAFAVRELAPRKMLFLVHREQIARQAIKSYRRVFGDSISIGLLSGNSKEYKTDFLFSTMSMMAKPEVLEQYNENEFDLIILDECHRAGSESYQRIMQYYKPKLWLGMTASPDTIQYDIYSLFDHNIVYEIRLQQALEEDLLCPFHYFGITDLIIDGKTFDDNTGVKNFANLVSDDRVKYVIEQAEYYSFSGKRVKGLVFCSRQQEAKELSAKFNKIKKKNGNYYRTEVLTGEDSQTYREKVIERLAADEAPDMLDYIFTVDVFNEGVDVPEINQVIMLRPTQSPVVFIQQLGRGLRKAEGKEYVVILDFIGNYMNNFMIPIALSGDLSYNKDAMRRYIREGSRIIPGASTIHFDEISKKRIYESIDSAKTNTIKLLVESYVSLKYKLGRIPTLMDFKNFGSIEVVKIFEKFGSYHEFLKLYENDYTIELNTQEKIIIEFLSRKLVNFKRLHEIVLLQHLISQQERIVTYYRELLKKEFNVSMTVETEESVYRNLTNSFSKNQEQKKYTGCVFIEKTENGGYRIAPEFQKMLQNNEFRNMVIDILEYGMEKYKEQYSHTYSDTNFQLYQKYTYEDVCRLLNWKRDMNAQNIGGYFYDATTKTLPVFINYEKGKDAIAYEDRFVSEQKLIALSKHPRKVTSKDADHIYKRNPDDADNRIFLFVRKNKDDKEAKEFYFLGEVFAEGNPNPIYMKTTKDNAFEITYRLEVPVRSDIYDYIVNE